MFVKGQLISECIFYVLENVIMPLLIYDLTTFRFLGRNFSNFCHWFFGRFKTPKILFEIKGPLIYSLRNNLLLQLYYVSSKK